LVSDSRILVSDLRVFVSDSLLLIRAKFLIRGLFLWKRKEKHFLLRNVKRAISIHNSKQLRDKLRKAPCRELSIKADLHSVSSVCMKCWEG
jgi:hypothetical protein